MGLCGMFLSIFTAPTHSPASFWASPSCQPLTNQRIHETTMFFLDYTSYMYHDIISLTTDLSGIRLWKGTKVK